jgi:hypothetical protein
LYSCHGLTAYESDPEGTLCKRDGWVYLAFTTATVGKRKCDQDVTNGVPHHAFEEIDWCYQKVHELKQFNLFKAFAFLHTVLVQLPWPLQAKALPNATPIHR